MVVNHSLTLDGLSELAQSDNTEPRSLKRLCACTHYLVFKEPEGGPPSPAHRIPTDRTISSVLGEPSKVTSPSVGCQQLSFHAQSPRQMLRDDDSGKRCARDGLATSHVRLASNRRTYLSYGSPQGLSTRSPGQTTTLCARLRHRVQRLSNIPQRPPMLRPAHHPVNLERSGSENCPSSLCARQTPAPQSPAPRSGAPSRP